MMFRPKPSLSASRVEARLARGRANVGVLVTLVVGVATFGAGVPTASAQGQPQPAGLVRVQTPPQLPDPSQTQAVAPTIADDQSPTPPADQTQGPPAQPPQTGSTTAASSGALQGQGTGAPGCSTPTGSGASGSTGSPQATVSDCKCPTKNLTGQATSKDRLFFFLPDFLTVYGNALPPMTTGQKFAVVAENSFDPVEFPWYAFQTVISQVNNADPTYGSGWGGFGKRYALNFANGTSENFMVGAIMPTIFHQDPRYYQMGSGGFWRRAGYAISRIVMTRTDCGRSTVNVSELLGAAATATLANLYQPRVERTLANTLSVWGTQMAYDTLAYVLREFWPDISKGLKHL
jgi:hypothetical protein